MKVAKNLYFLLVLFISVYCQAQPDAVKTVSGDYYDWKKTMQPERPWLHDYSQTVVMKLFLCQRDSVGNLKHVYLRFADALEIIKKLDWITVGVPKIIYLVGWQYTGHDSGYPSWTVVNSALKREEDATALESLHWLIKEAKKYHTTVSLHINMIDAFKNSPLWNDYDNNNIIVKDKNGIPIPGEVFDGLQSFQIDYAKEWETGYAIKRIDALLKMLPELKEGGTIHIDAFHTKQPVRLNDSIYNPYLGSSFEQEAAAQRKLFRYWRNQGLDVTSEGGMYGLRIDPFIGLQPMAWWFSLDEFTGNDWIGKPVGFKSLPAKLYCGTPMHAEGEIRENPQQLDSLVKQFFTNVVPWYYENNPTKKTDDDLWQKSGDEIFMPALWLNKTIVAYSSNGYTKKEFKLPVEWNGIKKVKTYTVSAKRLAEPMNIPVNNGKIILTINPGEGIVIQP
ncbi:MAG: endo-alpha-N-acetylgalactosaminidase family protein [Chitinophagaceae bacterium]